MKNYITALIALVGLFSTCAAEEGLAASPGQDFTQTLLMIGVALLFFYFILWRPEQKRRKAMDDLRNSMKKGDRIVAMGIVGTLSKINDQTVVLRMIDGAKIEMLKGAISEVLPATEEESKKTEE